MSESGNTLFCMWACERATTQVCIICLSLWISRDAANIYIFFLIINIQKRRRRRFASIII